MLQLSRAKPGNPASHSICMVYTVVIIDIFYVSEINIYILCVWNKHLSINLSIYILIVYLPVSMPVTQPGYDGT